MKEDLLASLTTTGLINQAALATPNVIEGPHGPGLIFRGETIHSATDPLSEARNWLGLALSRRSRQHIKPNLAMIFGLGLGWHIRAVRELFPDIKVFVFEPDKSLFDVYSKYNVLALGQEPEIIYDLAAFEEIIAKEVVFGEGGIPVVMALEGYAKLWPQQAARFQDRLTMEISRREVIDKTRSLTDSAFIENLSQNTGLTTQLPDLMLLKGRFPIRPAFIVGAGPSLAHNGSLLKNLEDRSLIICAAAALKPLLNLGVKPHVVLVLESSDTSSYLKLTEKEKAVLGPDCVLAAASGSHPAHFAAEGYHRALFHLNGGEAQLLGQGLFLPQGGNAGTAAFALAYLWGLRPLVLVGQDQAYEGALLHTPGTVDSVIDENQGTTIKIPGIGGVTVETNTSLLASLNWYVASCASIKRRPDPPRLINSTYSGASISGFEEIPLEILIKSLGPPPSPISLLALLERIPRPSVKEIRNDLKQMSALLTSLKKVLQVSLQRCIAEMMNTSKASAFMAQILAPALAAGHKGGILKNLIWADGVILKMLRSL